MVENKKPPPRPYVLGLLGGVGSGKSTVAGLLAGAGFAVIDADRLARRVLVSAALRPALVALLGPEVEDRSGGIDRRRVAAIVFADAEKRTALEDLVHPPVRTEVSSRLEAALAEGRSVVLDVPLLLEKGLVERCDYVVFVDAPAAVRRDRAARRGLDAADWQRREAAQAPLAEKRARADLTVDNSGSLAETRRQLAPLLGSDG